MQRVLHAAQIEKGWFMNSNGCFRKTVALLAIFLAGLCVAQGVYAQYDKGNIYVRVFSFDSEIKEITNGLVLLNNAASIDTFFNSLNNRYSLSRTPGTMLYRAVQTGISYLKADEMRLPDDVVAVNLITFTDGIDQGSTTPGLPPVPGYLSGDSLARMGPEECRAYLKRQFNALKVRGKPITGYSIGLMGTDVDPANQHLFADNLNAFSSEERNYQGERQTIDQIRENFREIGGRLYEQTRDNIITLEIPSPNPGTRVRWTFDIERDNNSSVRAAGSMRYLEGDFDYDANDRPLLKNIRYGGDIQSRQYYPGSTVTGKLNGMMVQFEFSQFSGANDTDIVREWLQISGSGSWQANVEFTPSAKEIKQERQLASVIYRVLDSSMSKGAQNINLIKESVAAALEPFGIRRGSPPPARAREPDRAPSGNPSNYLFVDFAPLLTGVIAGGFGIGLGYERAFVDPFSIAFYFDVIGVSGSGESSSSLFGGDLLIRPRWYPLKSAVGKWYLGAIVGYGMLVQETETYTYYGESETNTEAFSAFTIGLETGYKFVFGHFGLEPWLGYTLGSYGGFKIGATLGYVW
jgi:hypothetical protein